MKRFNDEKLNLELLAEECTEVGHIKSKIIRYGLDHHWDKVDKNNRGRLAQECGHVMAIITILIENGTISLDDFVEGVKDKMLKLRETYDSQRLEKKNG